MHNSSFGPLSHKIPTHEERDEHQRDRGTNRQPPGENLPVLEYRRAEHYEQGERRQDVTGNALQGARHRREEYGRGEDRQGVDRKAHRQEPPPREEDCEREQQEDEIVEIVRIARDIDEPPEAKGLVVSGVEEYQGILVGEREGAPQGAQLGGFPTPRSL